MLISEGYREQNRRMHQKRKGYGAKGDKWADTVSILGSLFECRYPDFNAHILDYGCGKASLSRAVEYNVTNYDPCIEEYNQAVVPHSIVVCTDVLEHIEPPMLGEVLGHLHVLTLDIALLTVATRPAKKTLPDGRNAHLIVESREWWEDRLSRYFRLIPIEAKQEGEIAYLAVPKRM